MQRKFLGLFVVLLVSLSVFSGSAFGDDARDALAGHIGPIFSMENLSSAWEVEERMAKLKVRAEAERDLLAIDLELFEMTEKLYKKKAVSKEEYLASQSRYLTTRANIDEVQASINYLGVYSKIFGLRAKIAAAIKISNREYAVSYLELWKAHATFCQRSVDRMKHEVDYFMWGMATQQLLSKKGASTRQDVLTASRKLIAAREGLRFFEQRVPVLECIAKEFQKIVDANGEVDPELPLKSPCKPDGVSFNGSILER